MGLKGTTEFMTFMRIKAYLKWLKLRMQKLR